MTDQNLDTFRVIKLDETDVWNPEIVALVGKIYGVYIFNPEERTYCCEITPSRCLVFIGSTWEGTPAWGELTDEQREEIYDKGDV